MISSCKKCGYDAGILNLKNGLCKSCQKIDNEAVLEEIVGMELPNDVTKIINKNLKPTSQLMTKHDPQPNVEDNVLSSEPNVKIPKNNNNKTGISDAEELYESACLKLRENDTIKATEYFYKLIDEYPSSLLASKSMAHLDVLNKNHEPIIPGWVFIVAIVIGFKTFNETNTGFDEIFPFVLIGGGLLLLNWVWSSWRNPQIDNADSNISSAAGWMWVIGIVNTLIGVLAKLEIWEPFQVDWMFQVIFGIGFFIAAIVLTKTRNGFTVFVLLVAIVVWGADTVLIGSELLLTGFKVETFTYMMLIFHVIILLSMIGGLSGLSGIFILRRFAYDRAVDKSVTQKSEDMILPENNLFEPKLESNMLNLTANPPLDISYDDLLKEIIEMRDEGFSFYLISEDFNEKNISIPEKHSKLEFWSPELVKLILTKSSS